MIQWDRVRRSFGKGKVEDDTWDDGQAWRGEKWCGHRGFGRERRIRYVERYGVAALHTFQGRAMNQRGQRLFSGRKHFFRKKNGFIVGTDG